MDIIVVKHSEEKYISSPFYVRFGGLKILKTKEKIVFILILIIIKFFTNLYNYNLFIVNNSLIINNIYKVEIYVNNVKSELTMRLNVNGDGYFVINNENVEENVNRKKRLSDIILNQSNLYQL